MEKVIYQVLDKIESYCYKAYLVGGYVRDFILGKNSYDVDICTNARPKELCEIFNEYDLSTTDYGTIVFHFDQYKFEITTFRKEISYKDHRKPDRIEYIDDLYEDLKRRDFKMNAVCMDKQEVVIDPFDGVSDIKHHLVCSIDDANEKLEEDILRLLRAIRFATTLNFQIDSALEKAIFEKKHLLSFLSYERKKEELNKIFFSENKAYGVSLLQHFDLGSDLELDHLENVLKTNDLIGMWALIQTNEGYPFSKNEKELMKKIRLLMNEDFTNPYVLYQYGSYPIGIVCDLKGISKRKWIHRYDKLPIKSRSEIALRGDEVCNLIHCWDGTYLKQVFDDLEEKILFHKLKNDPKKIREYLLKHYYKE